MTDFRLRSMLPTDREAVGRLLDSIFRHRHGVFDQTVLTDFPLVFHEANYDHCRVIEVAGQIVSHAAIYGCQTVVHGRRYKTALITLVATLEEHRRRGHAASIMRDLQRSMAEEQFHLGILWTGVPKFYEQLGWEVVVPQGWMIEDLQTADLSRCAQDNSTAVARPFVEETHLAGVTAIHNGESIRIERNSREYAALLTLPKVHTWVLERADDVVAYLCLAQGRNKHGVIESGGAPADVADLTARVVRDNDYVGPLQMVMYHPQRGLAQLFGDAGIPLIPLASSKGRGIEMILATKGTDFPASDKQDLFVWGLDTT